MYPLKTIGEFATVRGGKRVPKDHDFVNSKTIHPYIRARDIRGGNINSDDLVYISSETYEKIKKYTVKYNDVCVTIAGNIGDVGLIPYSLAGANLTENAINLIHLKNCDPNYLKFCLLHPDVQEQMKLLAAGAAQPKLGIYKVQSVAIPFPSIAIQRKIAGILSAYDDLIENNTRRIQILEEMAQTIYREWFIHFRFPGHENIRKVDSGTELGMIPEGWEIVPFSHLVEINPKLSINKDQLNPYVGMDALSTNSMCIDFEKIVMRKGNSGAKFQNTDVLFPRITPSLENGKTGYVEFLDEEQIAFGSTEFIVFREKELSSEIIYFLSREHNFRENAIKSMVGASGRQRVQLACFDNFLMPKPPKELIDNFSELVSKIIKNIHVYSKANSNLCITRDLLLPKLINGEIDVTYLDIVISE